MGKKYNWGIIGTGHICTRFCEGLSRLDNANIAAVCSRSHDKGASFAKTFNIDAVYPSVADMCADKSVDIVYVGTPHPVHLKGIMTAIAAGKHVLCEKPLTLNAKQTQAAADAARGKGVFLMEAMWTCFLPAVQKAMEWIKSGAIGEVKMIEAAFHGFRSDEDPSSRLFAPELGGGALLDLGVYPIFAANAVFGGNAEILHTESVMASTGVDRECRALLAWDNGRRALLSAGFDRDDNHATFIGTDGYITLPIWSYASTAYLFKNGCLADSFESKTQNGMEYEASHVMSCLDSGLTQSPDYPIDMTINALRICDALREQWGLSYPDESVSSSPFIEESTAKSPAAVPLLKSCDDWYRDAAFYHIYPLGLCGAPYHNDFESAPQNRLTAIAELIPHIKNCGFNAVYFGPVFESSCHGYDTANYGLIDRRLGTNEQFAALCAKLRSHGLRVILDGVFNHVGRDFWAFRDVLEKREASPYASWFNINFSGNSPYNDGLWYEGWEGCYDLVKLNLRNNEVREHIFYNIRIWEEQFGIDGLRLDVAYLLDRDFLSALRSFCKELRSDFFIVGECIFGDYKVIANDRMADSATNYEVYKAIHSAINSANMHELGYALHRQFADEPWTMYRGMSLFNFVENHDVSRIATLLNDSQLLPVAYALLFSMPGIPTVYYGGELQMPGDKSQGDWVLRPTLTLSDLGSMRGSLTEYITMLCTVRSHSAALRRGDYRQLYVQPRQLIFARSYEDERVICIFNTASEPHTAHFDAGAGRALDLISGQVIDFGGGLVIPPKCAIIGKVY